MIKFKDMLIVALMPVCLFILMILLSFLMVFLIQFNIIKIMIVSALIYNIYKALKENPI